jgi:hypothetical protein
MEVMGMGKLKLDIDALVVESFDTNRSDVASLRTVLAYEVTADVFNQTCKANPFDSAQTAIGCATNNNALDCQYTINYYTVNVTCYNSCEDNVCSGHSADPLWECA